MHSKNIYSVGQKLTLKI